MNRTICSFIALTIFLPTLVLAEPIKPKSPLKIGIIAPLTGELAEYGHAVQNGLTLAQQDHPEITQNCTFKIEDSKYDPQNAIAALQKLNYSDGIKIIYNWGTRPSEAIAPVAERLQVALFVWSADPRVAEGRHHTIRFTNRGADYAGKLADYLADHGYKKLAIVKTENQYIDTILDGLISAAASRMQIEVVDSYHPEDQDFRSTITKLKSKQIDALGVFLMSGQVSEFLLQLRHQQLSLPVFGTDFFESVTEVKRAGGAMDQAIFANNEVVSSFRKSYTDQFKNDLQINHAANAYDFAVLMCGQLAPQLTNDDPNEVLRLVEGVSSFDGTQGLARYTSSSSGDKFFRFPVVIRKIVGDKILTEVKN